MPDRRNTRQRRLVLDAVRARRDHPDAAQVYESVRRHDAHVSRATVYRNLHLLAQEGAILSIKTAGREHFDLRADCHPHIVCTRCGRVEDICLDCDDAGLDAHARAASEWTVLSHAVVFEGVCPACARADGPSRP